jgi:hypothetical protein
VAIGLPKCITGGPHLKEGKSMPLSLPFLYCTTIGSKGSICSIDSKGVRRYYTEVEISNIIQRWGIGVTRREIEQNVP